MTIARSDPQAQRLFSLRRREPMTLLDALLDVQRWHDSTLAFRWSCRIAMCGTCTVRLDGRPVLACQTPIDRARRTLDIEPLGGLPVVRDLIVDTEPLLARWAAAAPDFRPPAESATEPALIEPDSPERRTIDPLVDCISCGACFAACAASAVDTTFLGPAALARALALIADSRDGERSIRLDVVAGEGGIDSCHQIGACTAVCPKGVDPALAIRRLRRARLRPPK